MNPLQVSIEFADNVAKKPANKASSDQSANAGNFEKELSKQDEIAKKANSPEASSKVTEKKETSPADRNQGGVVAADGPKNGEALPTESLEEADSDVLLDNVAEQGVEGQTLELDTLVQPDEVSGGGALAFVPIDVGLARGNLKSSSSDALSTLSGERLTDESLIDIDGLSLDSSKGFSPIATGGAALTEGLDSVKQLSQPLEKLLSQPTEKLMTLNQIKASLEAGAEHNADLDVELDSTVKQTTSFNDIQLKESRSALRTYTTSVEVPFSQANWSEKVNDKIVWLANQKIQYAEIHISPADLGPMEVKINVQNDQATVTFNSSNQGVRELLEMNVNRLREMMGENGVDLAHVDVSDQSSQQQSEGEHEEEHAMASGDPEPSDAEGVGSQSIVLNNLVDYYA